MKRAFLLAGAVMLLAACNNDADRVEELEDRLARIEQGEAQGQAQPQALVGGNAAAAPGKPGGAAPAAPAVAAPAAPAAGPSGRIDPTRVAQSGGGNAGVRGNVCNDGIDRYLVVANNSGQVLRYFYASPPSADNWEEDVLGSDVVMSGDTYRINFNTDTRCTCNYDTKAVFADDSERVGTANVCTSHQANYR